MTASATARWEGLQGAIDGFRAGREAVPDELGRWVASAGEATRNRVELAAPRSTVGQVKLDVTGSGEDTEATVYLTQLARLIETGTASHRVAPKDRKALKIGNRFAAHADVGPMPARPYAARAGAAAQSEVDDAHAAAAAAIVGIIRDHIARDGGQP